MIDLLKLSIPFNKQCSLLSDSCVHQEIHIKNFQQLKVYHIRKTKCAIAVSRAIGGAQ